MKESEKNDLQKEIDQLKALNKKLEQKEQLATRLLDNINDLVFQYEFIPHRRFAYVSASATAITGYTPEEHYNDPDLGFKIVHPDDKYLLESSTYSPIQPTESMIIRWVKKDGTCIWTEQNITYHWDEAGNLCSLTGIARDITMHKQIEDQLSESQYNYSQVLNSMQETLSVLKGDGTILFCNRNAAFKIACADDPKDVIGRKLGDIIPPEQNEVILDNVNQVISNGKVLRQEAKITTKKGNVVLLNTLQPILYGSDRIPCALSISMDITDWKSAEHLIEVSEQKYKQVFEGAGEAIIVLDKMARVVDVNSSFVDITGISKEEVVGKTGFVLAKKFADKKNIPQLLSIVRNIVSGKPSATYSMEYKGKSLEINTKIPKSGIYAVGIIRDVTKQKEYEKALRESENLYRSLIETTSEGFWLIDEKRVTRDVNNSLCELMGYSREEIIGKSPLEFFDEENRRILIREMSQIESSQHRNYEIEFLRKDGKRLSALSSATTLYDEKRHIIGAFSMIKDITEIKEKEKALQESELFAKTIANTTPALLYIYDVGMRKNIWANDVHKKFFSEINENPDNFNAETIAELSHPDDFKALLQKMSEMISDFSIERFEHELRIRIIDRWKWMKLFVSVFKRNADGNVSQVIGALFDIDEEKRAEENLRIAKAKAEESEHKVRSMFENTLTGILYCDPNGKILEANPAILKMVGSPSLETSLQLNLFNNETLISIGFADDLKRAFSDKVVVSGEKHYVSRFGKSIYVKYSLVPLIVNNTAIGVWANLHDLTDLWETQNSLKIAKERAEESDRLKSAFLANMSHEIRTPMNGILGFAELLKEPELSGKQQQDYIKIIEKSGRRMLNIINDIIDISKIESGLMEVNLSMSHVNDQLDYVHHFFSPEAAIKGINFTCSKGLRNDDAVILTDKEKLYAILTNLVKNALKYTRHGQIELGYKLLDSETPYLEFYVKDTGIGIPKDRQNAIFERFIQADVLDTRAFEGAGLGLAITKAYLDMLGGSIRVESKEGEGSVFYFTIPYTRDTKTPEESDEKSLKKKVVTKKKLKVLLAEDDEASQMLVSYGIKYIVSELLTVKTGFEAVEACRNNPDIDLILMDIRMPDMNGYDATKQIREFNEEVVIIAQTAYGLAGDRQKAIEAGCNDYLSKPIKLDKLTSLLKVYFG